MILCQHQTMKRITVGMINSTMIINIPRDSVCNDPESSAGSEHLFSVPFFSCDDHETRNNYISRDTHSLFESMRKARWNEPFTDPFDLFDSVMQSGVFSLSPKERQFFETNVEKLENLEQTFDTLDNDQLEKQRTNMLRSGKTPSSLSPRWDVSTKTQKSRKDGTKKIVSKLSRTILSSPSSLSSVSCNSAFGHRITKIEKVTIGLDGQKETKTKVVKRTINADSDSVRSLISSESSSIDSCDKSYADNYAYFSVERDFGLKHNDGCYGMDSKIELSSFLK